MEARLALGDMGCLEKPQPKASEPTFAEYRNTWLERASGHCKSSTLDYYKHYQERHIIPRFGSLKLSDITTPKVRSMIAELKAQGFAANTIRLAVASVRSVLSAAVEEKLIPSNPAIGLGKRAVTSNKPKRESKAMEPQVAERFLTCALIYPDYYPLFLVALRAGLREGEILALRWCNLLFERNLIKVERRWYHDAFDSPKGNRTRLVDMSQQLRQALLDLRDRRNAQSEDLVFPGERRKDKPISLRALLKKYFRPTLAAAGLGGFVFHDLRHSFGSLLVDAGAPLPYVSEQMGHSSALVTATVYAHALRKNQGFVNRLDTPQVPATQTQRDTVADMPMSVSPWFLATPEGVEPPTLRSEV
jgi:integrase